MIKCVDVTVYVAKESDVSKVEKIIESSQHKFPAFMNSDVTVAVDENGFLWVHTADAISGAQLLESIQNALMQEDHP